MNKKGEEHHDHIERKGHPELSKGDEENISKVWIVIHFITPQLCNKNDVVLAHRKPYAKRNIIACLQLNTITVKIRSIIVNNKFNKYLDIIPP